MLPAELSAAGRRCLGQVEHQGWAGLCVAIAGIAVADLALIHVAPGIFRLQSHWKEKPPYGASLLLQKALERDPGAAAAVQQGRYSQRWKPKPLGVRGFL